MNTQRHIWNKTEKCVPTWKAAVKYSVGSIMFFCCFVIQITFHDQFMQKTSKLQWHYFFLQM